MAGRPNSHAGQWEVTPKNCAAKVPCDLGRDRFHTFHKCTGHILQNWPYVRPENKSTLLLLLSRFSRVRLCVPHRRQPTRLPRPWDSPGKNTEVGCHFLLQCMKVKSESEVAQSSPTLSDPMDCSLPGSSVHGIFQARVLEWGAIAFSKVYSK